jgi:hypothetical protein
MLSKGFVQTKVDLGWIISGRKYIAKYPHRDVDKIIKTEASCDCMLIRNEMDMRRLIIEYKPKAVPEHLKQENIKQYKTQKTITVHYTLVDEPDKVHIVILVLDATVMDKT